MSQPPGDVDPAHWEQLNEWVGGRLIRVESPLQACISDGAGRACEAALRNLRNPFYNEDEPGAFQTTGWLGAYVAEPSSYAVRPRPHRTSRPPWRSPASTTCAS